MHCTLALLVAVAHGWSVPELPVSPRARPLRMKAKNDLNPYEISSSDDVSALFPLPAARGAVHVHKKYAAKGGMTVAKAPAGTLSAALPGLDLAYPGLKVLHADPPVLSVDGFLSEDECAAFAALRDEPAAVHELSQSATFSASTASARTSTSWFVAYQRAAPLLARAAALLGARLRRFEEPQLVRYTPGQCFNWHYDAVPPSQLFNGGQRVATLLVYLNDVPSGGGRTAFRDLRVGGTDRDGAPARLEVAPKMGRALIFCPAAADGTPDERTLHAGEPADADKWIAQVWLHADDYKPSVPEGTSHAEAEAGVREYGAAHGLRPPPG